MGVIEDETSEALNNFLQALMPEDGDYFQDRTGELYLARPMTTRSYELLKRAYTKAKDTEDYIALMGIISGMEGALDPMKILEVLAFIEGSEELAPLFDNLFDGITRGALDEAREVAKKEMKAQAKASKNEKLVKKLNQRANELATAGVFELFDIEEVVRALVPFARDFFRKVKVAQHLIDLEA